MPSVNKQRLEFCTIGFLNEMRRQHALLNPGADSPIKSLLDYPFEQRSVLMAAVQRALDLSDPSADPAFTTWAEKRAEQNQSTT